jgi:hypothetical protein
VLAIPLARVRTPPDLRELSLVGIPLWDWAIPFPVFWALPRFLGSLALSTSPFVRGFPRPLDASGMHRLLLPVLRGFPLHAVTSASQAPPPQYSRRSATLWPLSASGRSLIGSVF